MQSFVRFFVERHLLVNVLAVATIVLGYFFIKDTPREYIPSIAAPIIYINASLPGASARDIETKLTIPIEEAIEEVDGIDVFYSTISDNVSFTTVELFIDFTPEQIKVIEGDLRQAIDGITDFPPEMEDEPTLEQFNPGKWPVVEVALAGPPDALIRAAKLLERKFKRLDLVSRVTVVG
ncbi:MAG: efflux RND transporter permease subunit, partial [Gammaproteobacteria bacterium]